MKITDKYVFFWDGIYSQWYHSPIVIDDVNYNCCEQYMMHQKALFFGDIETAKKIMKTPSPRDQKMLGRSVKNFNKDLWDRVNLNIVYKANLAKFTQIKELREALLNTGNRILVEASPYDQIWGIGMGEEEPGVENPINWKGQNLLGQVITLVKQELLHEK